MKHLPNYTVAAIITALLLVAGCQLGTDPVAVTGVSLNKTTTTITVGLDEQLVATIESLNATNKNVTWVSSEPFLVVAWPDGVVYGDSAAIATITVTGNRPSS